MNLLYGIDNPAQDLCVTEHLDPLFFHFRQAADGTDGGMRASLRNETADTFAAEAREGIIADPARAGPSHRGTHLVRMGERNEDDYFITLGHDVVMPFPSDYSPYTNLTTASWSGTIGMPRDASGATHRQALCSFSLIMTAASRPTRAR